jgi:hypothetical protein
MTNGTIELIVRQGPAGHQGVLSGARPRRTPNPAAKAEGSKSEMRLSITQYAVLYLARLLLFLDDNSSDLTDG